MQPDAHAGHPQRQIQSLIFSRAFHRQAGYARTFKEIQAVVADAPQKDIAKCYKFLISDVKEKVEMVTPASLVRRFCAVLGLGLKEVKAAEEMARTAVPSEESARCVKGAVMRYSWSHESNVCTYYCQLCSMSKHCVSYSHALQCVP